MIGLDRPGRVRGGEEIDIAAIDAFLKGRLPDLRGEPEIGQFKGGASNLTYQLSYPGRDLILRRPPFGHRSGAAHDMLREAKVMAALKPSYPFVPAILATCDDLTVLGCPFYVMERLNGMIPRQELPVELARDAVTLLCRNGIDKLVELHKVDYRAAGLEALGKGEGYVRRQIEGWSERYLKARTPDAADYAGVMGWLKDKMPARDIATCVIHNDFRFDNLVLAPDEPTRVIGVLDWEMATLGDPLMDLGNSLAYWVEAGDDPQFLAARRQPTHVPGMLTRSEVIAYYGEKTGFEVENFDFYQVYGLFRLAVIAQQIYQRYSLGQAKNPEFAGFIHFTNYLERRCLDVIARSEL